MATLVIGIILLAIYFFMGSGTTAKVALDNGRQVLGYEINPNFIDTTYDRCSSCAGTSTTGKIQNELAIPSL